MLLWSPSHRLQRELLVLALIFFMFTTFRHDETFFPWQTFALSFLHFSCVFHLKNEWILHKLLALRAVRKGRLGKMCHCREGTLIDFAMKLSSAASLDQPSASSLDLQIAVFRFPRAHFAGSSMNDVVCARSVFRNWEGKERSSRRRLFFNERKGKMLEPYEMRKLRH